MSARIIEAEARISAVDATGQVFAAVAQKIRPLVSTMKSLNGAANAYSGGMNKAISRLQGTIRTLAPVASGAAAYEGMRGVQGLIHATVQATAERAHEAVRMQVAGMSDAEIAEAERISGELSERYRALSTTTIMHALRNMRSIVGTYEEAAKILDPMLKLRIAAMGAHPGQAEALEQDFDQLTKAFEIKGVTMDPQKFTSYMEGMAKAINVFGDTLRPTDYYEMFKYGRQATQNLSEQFMLSTAPTLAQELGGSSAGKAMSSFYQAIVTGVIKEQSVKEMAALGLVDPSKVARTKTGSIKGLMPGGIVGWQLAATDPYAWTNQVLLPALQRHGITDPQAIQATIGTIFKQATAAQMVGLFATQQARIQKDWNQVKGAKGLEAADIYQGNDPFIAVRGVGEQLQNLLAIAGGPLATPAAHGLNEIASGIVAIEEAVKDHPWLATGGVAATTGLVGGLSTYLGLLGLRSGLGWLRIGGKAAATGDLSGAAAIRVMQAAQAGGAATPGWLASTLFPATALVAAGGAALALPSSTPGSPNWRESLGTGNSAIGPMPFVGSLLSSLTGGSAMPHFGLSDVRSAVGMPAAEVKGSADLNVTVQVEPSDNFVSRFVSALANDINFFRRHDIGTEGSLGRSMPEAVAPR